MSCRAFVRQPLHGQPTFASSGTGTSQAESIGRLGQRHLRTTLCCASGSGIQTAPAVAASVLPNVPTNPSIQAHFVWALRHLRRSYSGQTKLTITSQRRTARSWIPDAPGHCGQNFFNLETAASSCNCLALQKLSVNCPCVNYESIPRQLSVNCWSIVCQLCAKMLPRELQESSKSHPRSIQEAFKRDPISPRGCQDSSKRLTLTQSNTK